MHTTTTVTSTIFYLCGDDVYIEVENLRAFLDGPYVSKSENGYLDEISSFPEQRREAEKWLDGGDYREQHGISNRPLYFGLSRLFKSTIWPLGGPGYTLNRAALEACGKVQIDLREDLLIA